jgi:hypothetical protein
MFKGILINIISHLSWGICVVVFYPYKNWSSPSAEMVSNQRSRTIENKILVTRRWMERF